MILLDTHAWIWWISDPEKLSSKARQAIDNTIHRDKIHISSISAWETAMLAARGRLKLTMDVRTWIRKSESLPFLDFIPVNNSIAVESVLLPGQFHNDPADRIIVATARSLNATIITSDEKILKYRHTKALW